MKQKVLNHRKMKKWLKQNGYDVDWNKFRLLKKGNKIIDMPNGFKYIVKDFEIRKSKLNDDIFIECIVTICFEDRHSKNDWFELEDTNVIKNSYNDHYIIRKNF